MIVRPRCVKPYLMPEPVTMQNLRFLAITASLKLIVHHVRIVRWISSSSNSDDTVKNYQDKTL